MYSSPTLATVSFGRLVSVSADVSVDPGAATADMLSTSPDLSLQPPSNDSATIKGIQRGRTLAPDVVIFDSEVNENSPILIIAVERRGAKDTGILAKQMENLAHKGLDIAESRLKIGGSRAETWAAVAVFLARQLIDLFKGLFRDTPLIEKVITEPYAKDTNYPVLYEMSKKQTERPSFDYTIKLEVAYS